MGWTSSLCLQTLVEIGGCTATGDEKRRCIYWQECWYCNYSEGKFEVFCPHGRHIAPIIVHFGTVEGSNVSKFLNFTSTGTYFRISDLRTPTIWNFLNLNLWLDIHEICRFNASMGSKYGEIRYLKKGCMNKELQ